MAIISAIQRYMNKIRKEEKTNTYCGSSSSKSPNGEWKRNEKETQRNETKRNVIK